MLLYYSSLEEKFKVYREQQILNLKAQEDQLVQAMIARDPSLAERFIEAKPEAKQEAKPEATMKKEVKQEAATPEAKREAAERSLKKKEDFNVSLIAELKKKQSSPNKGLVPSGSRFLDKQKDDIPLAQPVEEKRRSDYKSQEEREKEIAALEKTLNQGNFSKSDSDKLKKQIEKEKANLRKFLSKEGKLYAKVPVAQPIDGGGLRTKRCKVHF